MIEGERKLATVRKIVAIDPIEGADNIVKATVDGWSLVTQKSNNFLPGDLVVFFEIDSFLPICEKFEFLRKSSYRKMGDQEGFRLKTIKLRGTLSQGLILPLSEFKDILDTHLNSDGQSYLEIVGFNEGDDLTEILGVTKYEKPENGGPGANLGGKSKGNFPEFLRKTDQERIQNCFGSLFETFETTLKLDGSSMTVYYKDGVVGVCSRNLDLLEDDVNAFWSVARKKGLIDALMAYGHNIAIQGELCGPGIQHNRENLSELQMYVFDIYKIDSMSYCTPYERGMIFEQLKVNGTTVEHIPIIDPAVKLSDFKRVEDFLNYADRESLNHPIAEGVVFKSVRRNGHCFKAINTNYLLKCED